MSFHDGEADERQWLKREQAENSPIRSYILELCEKEEAPSLAPSDLLPELQRRFGPVSRSQVAYHLRWLQDAGLLPSS
jgi:hypothetical protein